MNLTLNMTDRELRAAIQGKPRERAKLVGSGFDRHWEYRGVRIASRRQSGWNSGSVWWSDPINGTSVTSHFKDTLLTLIDAALDGKKGAQMTAQEQADWEDARMAWGRGESALAQPLKIILAMSTEVH